MMSYLRMYRDKFVESNDLEYIYTNHSLKFVDYMEQIGLGDKIVEIGSQQLKDSVSFYNSKSVIQTVNTMNNHLNAINKFFVYLYKEGIADNIFNKIADYDAFREEIIAENNLKLYLILHFIMLLEKLGMMCQKIKIHSRWSVLEILG